MRKLKLYLDTSTISHLFADDTPDKEADTNKLWKDFVCGKYELFISPVVTDELGKCAEPKRSHLFQMLGQVRFQILEMTDEITRLAQEYIDKGVLSKKSIADCLHIAFAVVNDCDIIVSWNFKHLANYNTINKIKIVNSINRYKEISIIPPTMLLEEVDEQ